MIYCNVPSFPCLKRIFQLLERPLTFMQYKMCAAILKVQTIYMICLFYLRMQWAEHYVRWLLSVATSVSGQGLYDKEEDMSKMYLIPTIGSWNIFRHNSKFQSSFIELWNIIKLRWWFFTIGVIYRDLIVLIACHFFMHSIMLRILGYVLNDCDCM